MKEIHIKKCPCGNIPKEHYSRLDDAHWIECEYCGRSNFDRMFSLGQYAQSIKCWNGWRYKNTKTGLIIQDKIKEDTHYV